MVEVGVLPPLPGSLAAASGLTWGLWEGNLAEDPVAVGPGGGHVRRWLYAAAAGIDDATDSLVAVGAAIVEALPPWAPIGVAFAWAAVDAEVVTWQRRVPVGLSCRVGRQPAGGADARARLRGEHVRLRADGSIDLGVRIAGGTWLRAAIEGSPSPGGVLATPTRDGGWNVTEKRAGQRAVGSVAVGERSFPLEGGAWTDWTAGRQDRTTTWRWAAGTGRSDDGRRVGLNLSTGMNEARDGENLVFWDDRPVRLPLQSLAPATEDPRGQWRIDGPGWGLQFDPIGVRAADENLGFVRSRYVQPIGRFTGTLPDAAGTPVPVHLAGVTEDHFARW